MLLGPSGLTLLSESRDNIYPLQRHLLVQYNVV